MGDRRGRYRINNRPDNQASAQIKPKRIGWRIFGIALALNFVWEMAQMFAYANVDPFSLFSFLCCCGAAFADALYVMCVYWIGIAIRRTPLWVFNLGGVAVLAVISSGFITAFVLERLALVEHFWHYGETMPRLAFGVGLWPVLQLMLLPLLAFWFVSRTRANRLQTHD